jgi:hypothetical protein
MAHGKRISVAVNAEGTVIEVRFAADIDDLDYPEIARAVTSAAQQAAADAARQCRELLAPIQARRARILKLAELVEGMPDLSAEFSFPPVVSTVPPERRVFDGSALHYTDVEEQKRHGVMDSGW